MRKMVMVAFLICLLWIPNVNAGDYYNDWVCYDNPCGYIMAGIVVGMVVMEAVERYNQNQIPPDRLGYCPDERYPDGRVVRPSQERVYVQQEYVQPPQQRYFKKVWIPGSLQLRCSKGYYNFFGNFVPPECQRVWVPGYWELR
jgi:hypothetical protein